MSTPFERGIIDTDSALDIADDIYRDACAIVEAALQQTGGDANRAKDAAHMAITILTVAARKR